MAAVTAVADTDTITAAIKASMSMVHGKRTELFVTNYMRTEILLVNIHSHTRRAVT